jgi:hypothetical protein
MKQKKISIIALSSLFLFVSGTLLSAPQYDIELAYSSDSSYSDIVGGKLTICTGDTIYWGQKTNYSKLVLKRLCVLNEKPPTPWPKPPK